MEMTNKEAKEYLEDEYKNYEKVIGFFKLHKEHSGYPSEEQALSLAIKALEKLMYDRWIPVSEELPSKKLYDGGGFLRRILVAHKTDTIEYDFVYYDGYKWLDKKQNKLDVVAWKPFDPYKEN